MFTQAQDLKKMTAWSSTEFRYIDILDFHESELMQRDLHLRVLNGRLNGIIVGLQHPPVITLGVRGSRSDVLIDQEAVQKWGLKVVETDRGGETTYHNPGQLVIYPIVSFREIGIGVRDFVFLLEEVTVRVLAFYGVAASRKVDQPGLYTEQGKIASVGIKVSRGVSRHGIAINICNDLKGFTWIRVCGRTQQPMDNFRRQINLEEVFWFWREMWLEVWAERSVYERTAAHASTSPPRSRLT